MQQTKDINTQGRDDVHPHLHLGQSPNGAIGAAWPPASVSACFLTYQKKHYIFSLKIGAFKHTHPVLTLLGSQWDIATLWTSSKAHSFPWKNILFFIIFTPSTIKNYFKRWQLGEAILCLLHMGIRQFLVTGERWVEGHTPSLEENFSLNRGFTDLEKTFHIEGGES